MCVCTCVHCVFVHIHKCMLYVCMHICVWCVYVYMNTHVCVVCVCTCVHCECVCTHMHLCGCIWRPKNGLGVILQELSIFLLGQGSLANSELTSSLGWDYSLTLPYIPVLQRQPVSTLSELFFQPLDCPFGNHCSNNQLFSGRSPPSL